MQFYLALPATALVLSSSVGMEIILKREDDVQFIQRKEKEFGSCQFGGSFYVF